MTTPSKKARPVHKAPDAKADTGVGTATNQPQSRPTRAATLIALMRDEGGKSAAELADAVGWQVHSIRGFIAGTLKKRADLEVVTTRQDKVTRHHIRDRAQA